MKIAGLLFLAAVGCASGAQAQQPWSAIARQCGEAAAERMHAATGCAGCAGSWPSGALCAVDAYTHGRIPQEYTKKCIDLVWYQRLKAKMQSMR
jgi:hypothetical protein